ncbi:multidrug transporter [Arthrobacter sp. RIT-PI-e]|nr:multidrug transporter [Arthrobacter sp. RIT-PI-e]
MDAGSPRRLRDEWVALSGLSAVFLFEMLDNSLLTIALPTIGRDLDTTTAALQWVTGAYSVAFGGLMLLFGAIADRFGRRRIMLAGLILLAAASLATLFVTTAGQLITVRVVMGIAAAMTTPGSIALAFRLFDTDDLRVRAITVISTAGLVGLTAGPTAGGLVLTIAPWQVLVLVNVPIAGLAFIGIRTGIATDIRDELHGDPIDVVGALLGTTTIAGALITPTLFVGDGPRPSAPWVATAMTVAAGIGFVLRQRSARHPLVDVRLITLPLVSSGLTYKAAAGLAGAGLSYLVTLQLQLAWGWTPALAAVALLPQVVVLLGSGRLVGPFVHRVGLDRAAGFSAAAVVTGLAVFGFLGRFGYVWVLLALVLVAAGMRVVGVVAGTNVLRGLPADRTSIGAALVDTSSELATATGVAAAGTILSALTAGSITGTHWTSADLAQFEGAITVAGLTLTLAATALVSFGAICSRAIISTQEPTHA